MKVASNMEYMEQENVPDYEENFVDEFFTRQSKRHSNLFETIAKKTIQQK